jgi:clan AA aspartic protease
MIAGTVSADRDAVIPLRLLDADGVADTVRAVIDTGFTGQLALAPGVVAALGLPWVMDDETVLADGTASFFPVHLGQVEWHGTVRDVLVLAMDTDPLVGMELLGDSDLFVACRPGGAVEITQTLPPPAPAP